MGRTGQLKNRLRTAKNNIQPGLMTDLSDAEIEKHFCLKKREMQNSSKATVDNASFIPDYEDCRYASTSNSEVKYQKYFKN